ncbi:TraR/DksA C4-type zinc finger protein [Larsenimonas suaedae]|uniref:TraR/DksA C4-type zinc finger protein n=1 Tax=Larsenimonas suaedae TaxID=1851019 RepID=A0ABU1GZS4_9GAMM|nr:TraR/DksA C4-type zinc finger protein [Larsenimonas suaedae]MCM2973469.1 TraR/DksA C4-type zinc finger protein [Larsenimonas suaedae]MDR5897355.1 TraR/DksA C4-type zinc finger protein [Larsenimonas suaedae]
MADAADYATELNERHLAGALASRAHLAASHATECDDCGDDIPDARRKAAPFARTCIECQGIRELKAKGVRR